jgi:hypothetical protein
MPHWINQPWQRNLSKTASGKPGAVHAHCNDLSHQPSRRGTRRLSGYLQGRGGHVSGSRCDGRGLSDKSTNGCRLSDLTHDHERRSG